MTYDPWESLILLDQQLEANWSMRCLDHMVSKVTLYVYVIFYFCPYCLFSSLHFIQLHTYSPSLSENSERSGLWEETYTFWSCRSSQMAMLGTWCTL